MKPRLLPARASSRSRWAARAGPSRSRRVRPEIQDCEDREDDRLLLEERLTEIAEAEWKREAEHARRIARERGLDQAAIDQAIRDLRYPS